LFLTVTISCNLVCCDTITDFHFIFYASLGNTNNILNIHVVLYNRDKKSQLTSSAALADATRINKKHIFFMLSELVLM
jgi:hypothetical protein